MVLQREGARGALCASPRKSPGESYREKEGGPEEAALGELGRAGPVARASLASLPPWRRWRLSSGERARGLRTCWKLQLLRGRLGAWDRTAILARFSRPLSGLLRGGAPSCLG